MFIFFIFFYIDIFYIIFLYILYIRNILYFQITISNKARLFAVKMNKKDRKGRSEIESCSELRTPKGFWIALYG